MAAHLTHEGEPRFVVYHCDFNDDPCRRVAEYENVADVLTRKPQAPNPDISHNSRLIELFCETLRFWRHGMPLRAKTLGRLGLLRAAGAPKS
jgi:hypothetical protein